MVCQGQSIADSNAPLAQDMRAIVRERIAAGASDDDVRGFLTDRYGDYVAARPAGEARDLRALVRAGGGVRRRRRHCFYPCAPCEGPGRAKRERHPFPPRSDGGSTRFSTTTPSLAADDLRACRRLADGARRRGSADPGAAPAPPGPVAGGLRPNRLSRPASRAGERPRPRPGQRGAGGGSPHRDRAAHAARGAGAGRGHRRRARWEHPSRWTPGAGISRGWRRRAAAIGLGLCIPALAAGIYASLGTPGLPGRPFAEIERPAARTEAVAALSGPVEQLAARLEGEPDNLEGLASCSAAPTWFCNATPEAADALRRAGDAFRQRSRGAGDAGRSDRLGQRRDGGAGGGRRFPPGPRRAAGRPGGGASTLRSPVPRPAAVQEAYDMWLALAADTPADATWRGDLEALIRQSAEVLGVEPRMVPSGPTVADAPFRPDGGRIWRQRPRCRPKSAWR